ncbi:Radical S-adenosyl methionine domain-containing protein 1, mitochondrial, partial [Neolecta irregularis DAH-3]
MRCRYTIIHALPSDLFSLAVLTFSRLSSSFLGGTPSLARSSLFSGIFEVLSRHGCQVSEETEVTMEANPSSYSSSCIISSLGFTRLSMGVQSFDDEILRLSNRDHNAKDALKILGTISSGQQLRHGFSFDLMFGFPNQTLASWKNDLDKALPFAQIGRHISLYELTLEPGTPLHRSVKNGLLQLPNEDLKEEMYDYAVDRMRQIGIYRYEVSNFGRTSRNNFATWQGVDYIGIGPGAHSRIKGTKGGKTRIIRIPEPGRWINMVESQGHGTAKSTTISREEYMEELIVSGLRTVPGVSRQTFQECTDRCLDNTLVLNRVQQLCQDGFLEMFENCDGLEDLDIPSYYNYIKGGVRATDKGLMV